MPKYKKLVPVKIKTTDDLVRSNISTDTLRPYATSASSLNPDQILEVRAQLGSRHTKPRKPG